MTPTERPLAHLLDSTEGSGPVHFGPNWFAAVMGTGIVPTAAVLLPYHVPGLHAVAVAVWALAAGLLAVLVVATAVHWLRSPHQARRYGHDGTMAQFYGAPPMAFMTVGAGAIIVASSVISMRVAVDLDWVLWTIGTVTGLLSATVIPYRLFTSITVRPDGAFGGWLMPIVPPMVSASTGTLLLAHVASSGARATLFYALFAEFGMSLVVALAIITLIWSRLAHYGSSMSGRVPTLWIVLGPVGQSITAAGLLGANAALAVPGPLARAFSLFAILYGVPMWGFALLWATLALAITARTARAHLPFSLTWWSFTFPVGVTVTGTIRLAAETGLSAFRVASAVGLVALVGAWATVAARTARAAHREALLAHPTPTAAAGVKAGGLVSSSAR